MKRALLFFFATLALCQQVTINPVFFIGAGLNDATSGGTFSAAASNHIYIGTISATGTPDHFTWSKDGGAASAPVAITGSAQTLSDGVTITFGATTGHTLGDRWEITAQANGSISSQTVMPRGVGAKFQNANSRAQNQIYLTDAMVFPALYQTGGRDTAFAWNTEIAIAAARNGVIHVPSGLWRVDSKITAIGGTHGVHIIGEGWNQATIYCPDPTQNSCIEISSPASDVEISELAIDGPGKSASGTMHGIYSHGNPGNNGIKTRNVVIENFSGDGYHVEDFFSGQDINVACAGVHGTCVYTDGDQHAHIHMDGNYFTNNVDGYCVDARVGNPELTQINCGDPLGGGFHFGGPGGTSFAYPTIIGANIEGVDAVGGTGIKFEVGSNFAYVSGLQLYCVTVACGPAISFANMSNGCIWNSKIQFFTKTTGAWASPLIQTASFLPNASCLQLGDYDAAQDATTQAVTFGIFPSTDTITGAVYPFTTNRAIKSPGTYNTGSLVQHTATVTSATYAVTATTKDTIIMADATSNAIAINFDPATFFSPGQTLTVKKTDSSANCVTVHAGAYPIDGLTNPTVCGQYDYYTIMNDGAVWRVLSSQSTSGVISTGTFTPTLNFGGGSTGITYSSVVGQYYKIGSQVTVSISINLLTKGSSTGQMQLATLPFTPNATSRFGATINYISGMSSLTNPFVTTFNSTTLSVFDFGSGGTAANVTDANCTNSTQISITITYFI